MIQTKTVDITPMKITLPVIEMSQYDLGREIIIHMKDGSDWFDLTGYTAKLQGTKPSGFGYTVDGVVDGHDITFASNYDMTSEAGFIPSEVRLTKDGVSLGSLNVILHVEKTPHDASVTDGSPETIIPEMTELVERAEAAAEILLDCSATATTLPTGSSATASYDPNTGVFSFGLPRGAKGDTGATGETGNGISNIRKTSTSGLVDTYTITYTDGTTTTFTVTNGQNGTGSVADVTQNGVSVLDGTTAKVTVPTYDAVTDNEPYLFRTSGGSVDIGNREVDTLVGGTVAWNQRGKEFNSTNWYTEGGVTVTYNNGEVVMKSTTANNGIYSAASLYANHVYLGSMTFKCPNYASGDQVRMYIGSSNGVIGTFEASADYKTSNLFGKASTGVTDRLYITAYSNGILNKDIYVKNFVVFDLTQMFGSTIADYIYSLEQANAGAGVAWFKKLFPNPYYAYNAGELMSVKALKHITRGFNAWDEQYQLGYYDTTTGEYVSVAASSNWRCTKNAIKCLPNTTYYFRPPTGYTGSFGALLFYDASGNYIGHNGSTTALFEHTLTTPSNCYQMQIYANKGYFEGVTEPFCINLSWDGERDGEYEEYAEHVYELDPDLELRGIPKLSAGNNLYYDGDVYESDGTVTRRCAEGTISITGIYTGGGNESYDFATFTVANAWGTNATGRMRGEKIYEAFNIGFTDSSITTGATLAYDTGTRQWCTAVPKGTSTSEAKAIFDGSKYVYTLANPTTETAEPYTNPQVVDESGTEEYVSTSIVPVGHQTAYPDLFSGDYNDLVNKPTIPTETSQLTNDSDFVSDSDYVHTDNNYTSAEKSKLSGIASGAEVNVQSNWNETDSTADAYIANKPDINELKVLVVNLASFSSLPQTFYESAVTADHVCLKAELSQDIAQGGDWTVTTADGQLTISGAMNGATTAKLYLVLQQ